MDEDIDRYLPLWRQRLEEEASALEQRRQAAEEAARQMARILVQEFAAERVYLIGSLADRERFGIRFRHLFRNIYGFELRWNRIEELGHGLRETLYILRQDIERFLGFITSMQENS